MGVAHSVKYVPLPEFVSNRPRYCFITPRFLITVKKSGLNRQIVRYLTTCKTKCAIVYGYVHWNTPTLWHYVMVKNRCPEHDKALFRSDACSRASLRSKWVHWSIFTSSIRLAAEGLFPHPFPRFLIDNHYGKSRRCKLAKFVFNAHLVFRAWTALLMGSYLFSAFAKKPTEHTHPIPVWWLICPGPFGALSLPVPALQKGCCVPSSRASISQRSEWHDNQNRLLYENVCWYRDVRSITGLR